MRNTGFSQQGIFDVDGEPFFAGKRSEPYRATWFYSFVATLINARMVDLDA